MISKLKEISTSIRFINWLQATKSVCQFINNNNNNNKHRNKNVWKMTGAKIAT